MDRPEPVFCYACKAELLAVDLDMYVWRCSSCGSLTQKGPEETTRKAEPGLLALQAKYKAAEEDYKAAVRPYLLPLGLPRQSPKWVPPDSPGILAGAWFALLVAGVTALGLMYAGLPLAGLLLGSGVYLVVRFVEAGRLKKVAAYKMLTAEWEARRVALDGEMRRLVYRSRG